MLITNETDRNTYLPQSRLFSFLERTYTDTIEWWASGNPHDLTPAGIVATLKADNVEPLNHDWDGVEDAQLTPLWADLAYPLPADADEMAHPLSWNTPSDIARAALAEYANQFDLEGLAERVLTRLRAEYDKENGNV